MTVALVDVQLAIDDAVLDSGASYRAAIETAAAAAVADAPNATARLIVFPEIAGHLALYALAPPAARRGKTLASALASAAVRRPLDMLRGAVTARVLDPRHAVLAGLAPDAERYWRALFAHLARAHAAYVVAGSHLRLAAGGALTSASHLFGPDGALVATTDKVNLLVGIEDAAPGGIGLARGDAARLPITDTHTALGRIATLIGYDAFRAPLTPEERFVALGEQLAVRGGCAIVANPACNRTPWSRSDGADGADARWRRDGLPGALAAAPIAQHGVTAHVVGGVLDQRYAGASEILTREASGEVRVVARAPTADHGCHVVAAVDTRL